MLKEKLRKTVYYLADHDFLFFPPIFLSKVWTNSHSSQYFQFLPGFSPILLLFSLLKSTPFSLRYFPIKLYRTFIPSRIFKKCFAGISSRFSLSSGDQVDILTGLFFKSFVLTRLYTTYNFTSLANVSNSVNIGQIL